MNDGTLSHSQDWFFPQTNWDSELLQQWGFVPGLPEFLKIRQVHALEHATVWVLSSLSRDRKFDDTSIGGVSTDKGFFLYGKVNTCLLKEAVTIALNRLQKGEWDLALHPRCGTNASVAALLTAGMMVTTHLALPKEPISQFIGMSCAGLTANYLAPEIGMSVQKYLTTAIPFNLKLREIEQTLDKMGRPAHFVRLQWQNLQ